MAAMAGSLPRDLRLRLDLAAQLVLGSAAPVCVHVIDLSTRGAFVETDAAAQPGASAQLRCELSEGELRLDAVVVREGSSLRDAVHPELDALVVRVPGVGLRFVSLRKGERLRLAALLRQVRREG